ncbi:GMC family oxidoreductase [Chelatococcus asaccharovorans]|uniref:Choline dehydrogenase-like flavoprotein n=1 Tax=Chelatococcus asaccharovorans TaxID=28210 RepID=A0A2V3U192_9HYPH|nr:GMC family oxidoreductase N-terminal domain-containing protein [Chelatococcus asaccharovorans]MBS7707619.1 GMC family oxidoreductase N-terminal domain-containing protein [Chelatococcus asaccharovorans]PXW55193.1 choline dehydrogenase-like flavoprotein [Chelatococcus asaccharovorans]
MIDAGTFDYVVVGAGTAGCLMANRLSADPQRSVCLLEAGGRDNWIWFHVPVGYLYAIGNPRADWMFTTEPEPGLDGRVLNYPRGKVIGGCSAINAMIYMRGQRQDYDRWRDLGLTGWGWDDVQPLFRRHLDHFLGAGEHHAVGGEWRVEAPRVRWALLDAFLEAAVEAGIPRTNDFNTGNNEGIAYFHVNQKQGRRWSAARGFLKPVLNRPGLRLETQAHVAKLVVENGRVTGVDFVQRGELKRVRARAEVILCAGAVGTPQILQLSGIGDAGHLSALGIPVIHDAPGVGENLQDHLQLRPIYRVSGIRTLNEDYGSLLRKGAMALEYALLRRGALTMAPSQLGAFTRSSPDQATPNIQFHVQPLSLDKFGEMPHAFPAFTASVCNLRPTSRGSVRLASPDPAAQPAIRLNALTTPEDARVAIDSLNIVRRIVAMPALQRYRPEEYRPGAAARTDDDLLEAARQIGTTIFHPVGTARMGTDDDATAVVDERLRLRGVAGLRVADASVMPFITSGNTNSPTLMIAEKAATMIREDNH